MSRLLLFPLLTQKLEKSCLKIFSQLTSDFMHGKYCIVLNYSALFIVITKRLEKYLAVVS